MSNNEIKELEKRVSELESELKDIKSTLYTPDKEAIYKAKFNLMHNPLRFDRLMDPITIRMKPDKFIKYKYRDCPKLAFKLDEVSVGKLLARLVGGDDRLQKLLSSLCNIYLVKHESFFNFNILFDGDGIYRIEKDDDVHNHINMIIHDKSKFRMITDIDYYKSTGFGDWCYARTDEIAYDETMVTNHPSYLRFKDEGGTDLWIDATIGYKYDRGE